MIISVRKWIERGKFVALFLFFTFVLYHFLQFMEEWMAPTYRYQAPSGKAAEVMAPELGAESASMKDRLFFYYWFGE